MVDVTQSFADTLPTLNRCRRNDANDGLKQAGFRPGKCLDFVEFDRLDVFDSRQKKRIPAVREEIELRVLPAGNVGRTAQPIVTLLMKSTCSATKLHVQTIN
ncbi:hypothetical protein ES703_44542 [subsurface metagenome]